MVTICENCGRVIGLKETPCVFNNHTVCEECHEVLDPKPLTRMQKIEQNPVFHYLGVACTWLTFITIGLMIGGILVASGMKAWEWMNKDTITIKVVGK